MPITSVTRRPMNPRLLFVARWLSLFSEGHTVLCGLTDVFECGCSAFVSSVGLHRPTLAVPLAGALPWWLPRYLCRRLEMNGVGSVFAFGMTRAEWQLDPAASISLVAYAQVGPPTFSLPDQNVYQIWKSLNSSTAKALAGARSRK